MRQIHFSLACVVFHLQYKSFVPLGRIHVGYGFLTSGFFFLVFGGISSVDCRSKRYRRREESHFECASVRVMPINAYTYYYYFQFPPLITKSLSFFVFFFFFNCIHRPQSVKQRNVSIRENIVGQLRATPTALPLTITQIHLFASKHVPS